VSTPAASSPTAGRRRVKKRILIPSVLLGLLVAFVIGMYVRGTWADAGARNPATAAAGTLTQLVQTKDGSAVRCAIVIDAPADKVWEVVRDYKNHPRFLPYVSAMDVEDDEGDKINGVERLKLSGVAHSRLWGDWPFVVHVDHKKISDKEYVALWNEPSPGIAVNRGSWTVTSLAPGQTLVALQLQAEAEGCANFLVRNVLMDRLHRVVAGLRDESLRRQAGK
jgi:carbon monoxide dehydrogenase subunit G